MKHAILFSIFVMLFAVSSAQEPTTWYNYETMEYESLPDTTPLFSNPDILNFDNLSPIMFNLTIGHVSHGTTMGIGMSVYGFYFEWLCNMDIEGGSCSNYLPEFHSWTGSTSREFNFGYYFPLCKGVDIAPIISYERYQTIAGDGNDYWLDNTGYWHNDYHVTSTDERWGFGASVLFYFPLSKTTDIGSWGLGLTFTSNYWGFNLVVWRMSK